MRAGRLCSCVPQVGHVSTQWHPGWCWLKGWKVQALLLSVDLCQSLIHITETLWSERKTTLLPRWSYRVITTCNKRKITVGAQLSFSSEDDFRLRTTQKFNLLHSFLFDFFQKRLCAMEMLLLSIPTPPAPVEYAVPHPLFFKQCFSNSVFSPDENITHIQRYLISLQYNSFRMYTAWVLKKVF